MAIATDPTSDYLVFDDPDRGRFNTGQFAPAGGVWTIVSTVAKVKSLSTNRGRQRLFESYDQGEMTVVFDDVNGLLTPHNTASAYSPFLRPDVRIRSILVMPNLTEYPLFYGFVDWFLPQFGRQAGGTRYCTIHAVDAFDIFARFNPAAASSPVGEGESVSDRLHRLHDLQGWPAGDRDFDEGLSTLQSTTMAQNTRTECQLAVDSEGGEWFIAANGKSTYRDRHARYERFTSLNVQATFTDVDSPGALHYESLDVPKFDAALVKNPVSIASTGSEAASAIDVSTPYWDRPWSRHDLIHDGGVTESQHHADRLLWFYKNPEQRIDGIQLKALDKSPAGLWAAMYGLDFGHRVRAVQTLTGDDLDQQLFIEGVAHEISMGDSGFKFETTLRTSSAARIDAGRFIFDHATLGKFDTGTFAPF
jgi:hypothetical protein